METLETQARVNGKWMNYQGAKQVLGRNSYGEYSVLELAEILEPLPRRKSEDGTEEYLVPSSRVQ